MPHSLQCRKLRTKVFISGAPPSDKKVRKNGNIAVGFIFQIFFCYPFLFFHRPIHLWRGTA